MKTTEASRKADRVPVSVTVVQALSALLAVVWFPGVLLYGAGAVLWIWGWVIAGDEEFRSYPHWLDYADLLVLVVLVASEVSLALAVVGLTGPRAHRAWIAGLVGGGLVSLTGVALALAPLTDPNRSTAGGWGQPWMPEILIGGAILALSAVLLWLLLLPVTRRWARAKTVSGVG